MIRIARRFGVALGLVLVWPWAVDAARPLVPSQGERPDPATIERYGPAYRYPKAGWIVLHIEGEPYERGYQHGRLLAPEIADFIKALATKRSPKAPADAWREHRKLVNALFLRRYDKEYLEEMKGIVAGAAAAGAKFQDRALDLLDVVAVNSEIEIEFLDGALDATPTGLEGQRFAEPNDTCPRPTRPEHCSAFAATGPATADGQIVFGHITMFNLYMVRHFNVWLDVKPAEGHRVLMQTFPGGIMSGMDYYLNDAGMLVAETTIDQTRFDADGQSLASRIRKALQYADSIDAAVAILEASNNGMYTNEWLLADTKTNEIAMFELGTRKSKLWRSSRDEWLGGTKGFYWGCNNTKDIDVRLETVASVAGKPANVVFHPSDRDRAWIRLYEAHKGKISEAFGFEAFTTPPIAGSPSCDAKFTTSAMARDLKTWALFGPPLGRTWEPTEADARSAPQHPPAGRQRLDGPDRRGPLRRRGQGRGRGRSRLLEEGEEGGRVRDPRPPAHPPRRLARDAPALVRRRRLAGRRVRRLREDRGAGAGDPQEGEGSQAERGREGPARPCALYTSFALSHSRRAPPRRHPAGRGPVRPDPGRVVSDRLGKGGAPPGRCAAHGSVTTLS